MSTSPSAKAGYHHGGLREALVEAGLAILEEGGDPASLGLREAARRAGVSAMAPYRHFPDKDALLAAVATVGFERLRAALEAADDPGRGVQGSVGEMMDARSGLRRDAETSAAAGGAGEGQAALVAQGVAYIGFAAAHPGLFRLMFRTCAAEPPEALAAASSGAFGVLAHRVAALMPPERATDEALRCWALVHGIAVLALDGLLGADLRGNREAVATLAERLLALDARGR